MIMDCGTGDGSNTGDDRNEEGRDYVMAAPLPVHPDDDNAQPILKRVKIKSNMCDTNHGDDCDRHPEHDEHGDSPQDYIVLDLDDDEKHLFASIQAAAKAWEEGRLDFGSKDGDEDDGGTTSSLTASTSKGLKVPGGIEVPVIPTSTKKVQVRVAGGWVRDKILGLQTHDVDIALDTCTGVEFATVLKTYVETMEMEQQREQERHRQQQDLSMDCSNEEAQVKSSSVSGREQSNKNKNRCGRIGVIAANPDQSKHLETATMKIFGIEVDFTNLRHETYAEDSRIPDTVVGTPLEDAYRRDFTMNSLFYNLHTQCIEDWTRRGLSDLLETKVVQTPLESYQTFHDDPLRVLRAIRFAVRYDMELSPDLRSVCMHPQIHNELHRKVSRERVGKELEGMLSGKHANPRKAIDLICSMKLAGSVFCIPASPPVTLIGTIGQSRLEQVPYHPMADGSGVSLARLREVAWEEARECVQVLPNVVDAIEACRQEIIIKNGTDGSLTTQPANNVTPPTTVVDGRLVYLSTVLLPFEHLQYVEKQKSKTVAEYMVKDGIKFKTKDITSVVSIVLALDDMVQLLQSVPESTPTTRLQAGMILRATKQMWVTTLVVATVSLVRRRDSSKGSADAFDWCARAQEWYRAIVSDMMLDGCWTVKPLMNGKDLMEFLGLPKGPEIGVYTQEQVKWMLMTHPDGTVDGLQQHLKTFQESRDREENQAAQHVSKKMHL